MFPNTIVIPEENVQTHLLITFATRLTIHTYTWVATATYCAWYFNSRIYSDCISNIYFVLPILRHILPISYAYLVRTSHKIYGYLWFAQGGVCACNPFIISAMHIIIENYYSIFQKFLYLFLRRNKSTKHSKEYLLRHLHLYRELFRILDIATLWYVSLTLV